MVKVKIFESSEYLTYDESTIRVVENETPWTEITEAEFYDLCSWAQKRNVRSNPHENKICVLREFHVDVKDTIAEYREMMEKDQERAKKAQEAAKKRKREKAELKLAEKKKLYEDLKKEFENE